MVHGMRMPASCRDLSMRESGWQDWAQSLGKSQHVHCALRASNERLHASRIVSTFRIADACRTDRDARGASDSPMSKLRNRRRDTRSAKTPRTDIAFQLALLAANSKRSTRHGKQRSDSPTPTDRDDVSRPATATVRSAERTRHAWSHQNMKLVQDGSRSAPRASRCRGPTPSDASGGMSRLSLGCKPPEPSHRAKNWQQTGTDRARNDEGLATA